MPVRHIRAEAIVVAAALMLPASARAAIGERGQWYGVFTDRYDASAHTWAPYGEPMANGITLRFTVARAPGVARKGRRIVIKSLSTVPFLWSCPQQGTTIRVQPALRNVRVSRTGKIAYTFSAELIANPVLDPPVDVPGWRPRAILALTGRFSATGFADGTMFVAVNGCGWTLDQVWIAVKPRPSELSTLTTPPPSDVVPSDPVEPDSDGEAWLGCHLLWCTPYSLPPFAPTSVPSLG